MANLPGYCLRNTASAVVVSFRTKQPLHLRSGRNHRNLRPKRQQSAPGIRCARPDCSAPEESEGFLPAGTKPCGGGRRISAERSARLSRREHDVQNDNPAGHRIYACTPHCYCLCPEGLARVVWGVAGKNRNIAGGSFAPSDKITGSRFCETGRWSISPACARKPFRARTTPDCPVGYRPWRPGQFVKLPRFPMFGTRTKSFQALGPRCSERAFL